MAAGEDFGGSVAAVGVSIGQGSRYETAETNGLSAVVHAAALKEASAQVAKLGGTVTGKVGRESSTYVATVLKKHASAAAAALSAAVSTPPSTSAFEAAKASVLAKIGELPTNEEAIIEEMQQCAYLDTAMGMPVYGSAESVAKLKASDAAMGSSKGVPFVATAGGDLAQVVEAFASIPAAASSSSVVPAPSAPPKAIFTGSDKKIYYESLPVARFAFAYEFPSLDSEHAAACRLLPYLLTPAKGAYASKTSCYETYNSHVKIVRDHAEQNCVETATPFYLPFTDSALFGIALTAKDVRVEDCSWYTCNNLVRLCFELSEAELARAKLAFQSDLLASFASPGNVVTAYLDDLRVAGRAVAAPELVQRVNDLDLKALKNLAYTFIHDNDHALAAIGPLHELPDYNWFRTATYNYHY